ncbi:MAG: hypothetical protein JNG44_04000 [Porphyromonas sp.]|uniref:hypothetical protein n=1 Tax=Porphyromonas sp. TaxID=1924944 RepID=UPI001A3B6619|nr:hypothetical protein [Porphyromonas sp.]MBL6452846.1 hypothetical protein [Porphyromonas sp.]
MNKIYRIASATLAMVLLLLTMGSCSQESQLAPDAQQQAGAGQLAFKLDNDALRSVPAEAFEKEVDPASVWCVFVTSDPTAPKVKEARQATEALSGEYMIKAGFEGAAQMFVVANVQDALKTKLEGLTPSSTLAEVQRLVVENALGDNTKDPDKFIMTSELMNVMLPTVGGTPYKVADAIKLKRLAARFDVINEVPGLTLTTVSAVNRVTTSTLLNVNETGTIATTATDYAVAGGKQLLHKIYSYQNTNKGGAAKATSFIIKGNYGSKAIKDIQVDLKDATNGEALDVQRNYCYRIIIKPAGSDDKPVIPDPTDPTKPTAAWKVTIKVIDWNEATADLANYSDEDLEALGTDLSNTVNPTGTNLLNAVAEYDIDITGTKFTTSHTNEAGNTGYFTWAEAKALTMPAGYHLPTINEWFSILGSNYTPNYVYFNRDEAKKDVSITVQIPGQSGTISCLQDVKQVSEGATYMIRYKNNDTYRSAWCYSYVDGPITGQKVWKIESVPVKAGLTIDQLDQDYFELPKVSKYVKTIYLPTTGYDYNRDGSSSGLSIGRGSYGYFWSATEISSSHAYSVRFIVTEASIHYSDQTGRRTVRPFRGI